MIGSLNNQQGLPLEEFCNQGVYILAPIHMFAAAISMLALLTPLLVAVMLHELGHALPGWIVGGDAAPTGFGGGLFTLFRSYRRLDGRWIRKRNVICPHVRFDNYERLEIPMRRVLIVCGPLANLVVGLPILLCLNDATSMHPLEAIKDFMTAFQAIGYGCDVFLWGDQQDPLRSLPYLFGYLFAISNLFLFSANLIPFAKVFDGYRLINPR